MGEPASASCEEVLAWLADKPAQSLGEPTAALRRLMSHAALGDCHDTADPMHVPRLAAEGILEPGTRVPVAAVAALIRALGVRVILGVEVRGKPVVWSSVGGVSAPFLGGLHVSNGHMNAVLCDDPGPMPHRSSSDAIRVTFGGAGATFHMPGGVMHLAPTLTVNTPDAEAANVVATVTDLPVLEQRRIVNAAGELLVLPFPWVGGASSSKEGMGAKGGFTGISTNPPEMLCCVSSRNHHKRGALEAEKAAE